METPNFLSDDLKEFLQKNGSAFSSLNILGTIHEILTEMTLAEGVPTDVLVLVNIMLRGLERDLDFLTNKLYAK